MYQYKIADNISPEENINIFKYNTFRSDTEHTHEFIEIVYIIDGSGHHNINHVCYNVKRGDLLFINFNQTHSFSSHSGMTIVNCILKPEFVSRELINSENANEILTLSSFEDFKNRAVKLIPKVTFYGKGLIEIEILIENMLAEFQEKAPGYKAALKGYLHIYLTKIFREIRNADTDQIFHQLDRLTPEILKYIEEKCFEKITLNDLAAKCFYNPSYLSRIFKECYGKSFINYIHEKRINEAFRLMSETNLAIEDICYTVGYKEKKQFYKIFKQFTGETPNTVRESMKRK